MAEKLAWDEIKKRYDQQWIELVDYDWPEGQPYPREGVVRVHAADRREFHTLLKAQEPAGSALLFVGAAATPQNLISTNLFTVRACE